MINNDQFIPCPACETKIPFDIQQLLNGFKFSCPKCGVSVGLAGESVDLVEESIEKLESLKQSKNN